MTSKQNINRFPEQIVGSLFIFGDIYYIFYLIPNFESDVFIFLNFPLAYSVPT